MSKLVNPLGGKPIVALDFDGCIHIYKGWNGGKLNEPMPGAREFIEKLQLRGFRVVIHSTRDEAMIRPWLEDHGFPALEICSEKPAAVVFLDDRALTFRGTFTNFLVDEVANFRPYWETNDREL